MLRLGVLTVVAWLTLQPLPGVLRIDVVASSRGEPVGDLKAEDLEVWLNGRRLPVDSVRKQSSASNGGRLIVLLLDDLTTEPAMVLRVREAADRFVAKMRPGDRFGVHRLSGGALDLSQDPGRLRTRVGSFNQSAGLVPLDRIGAHLLTSLAGISGAMAESPERRKIVVAIGSGWLFDTPIPSPQVGPEVRREWTDAMRAMGLTDVTYYVIDPAGVGRTRTTSQQGFARETGGQALMNTNDIAGAVDRILHEADEYYEIIVKDPPFGRTAPLRELDVRSVRKDVTVRARRWLPGALPNR